MRNTEQIMEAIGQQDQHLRAVRSRVLALRAELARQEAELLPELTNAASGTDVDSLGNNLTLPIAVSRSGRMNEILGIRATLQLIESTEQYRMSCEIIDPLYVELEQAKAAETAEQDHISAELRAGRQKKPAAELAKDFH